MTAQMRRGLCFSNVQDFDQPGPLRPKAASICATACSALLEEVAQKLPYHLSHANRVRQHEPEAGPMLWVTKTASLGPDCREIREQMTQSVKTIKKKYE